MGSARLHARSYFYRKFSPMKAIRILFLCLSAWPVFAQDYHPLIQAGVYRDEFGAPEMGFCVYDYGGRYWFRGDTMIAGQTYQVLCRAGIRPVPGAPAFCPPYTVDTTECTLYALMRESVPEKQVFQFNFETGTEFLLFDFSVQAGDSVTVGHPPQTVYVEAEGIEPWTAGSGRRKIIVQSPLGGQAAWVEGLGALNSLWDPLAPMCICPHLICYQESGQTLTGGECATVVRTEEPGAGQAGLVLTPNPVSETITIMRQEGDKTFDRITIFTLSGQIMAQHYTTDAFSVDIPVGHWPVGSYVAIIWQDGQWLAQYRFQKH